MTDLTNLNTFGRAASRGMLWTSFAHLFGRGVGLLAQWALGLLLADGDFGLYAIAISASALLMAFQNAGLPRVLVQRGADFARLGRPIWILSFATNIIVGCTLLLSTPLVIQIYDNPALAPLMLAIAISVPLNTPGAMFRAKLSIDLRFRELSVFTSSSLFVRHSTTVIFALLGFGAMSFVLPLIVVALYQIVHGTILTGWMPRTGDRSRSVLRELFPHIRWLLVAAFAGAMITRGDYLVVGKLESQAVTGQYFFAFQLLVAMTIPFTQSLTMVMVPMLVRLRENEAQYGRAYLRAIQTLVLASAALAGGCLLVVGPAIQVLWGGKWDVIIVASQILAIPLVFSMGRAIAHSVVESHGRWRMLATIFCIEGIAMLLAAGLGAWLGGLTTIAIAVGTMRVLSGIVSIFLGGHLARVSPGAVASAIIWPIALAAVIAGLVFLCFDVWLGIESPAVRGVLLGGTFALLFGAVAWWAFKDVIQGLLRVVRRTENADTSVSNDLPAAQVKQSDLIDSDPGDPRAR